MKYTLKTISYNLKNFFYVFPLVILPAFLLSFTVAREEILAVYEKILAGTWKEISFAEVFQAVSIFNFSSWEAVLAGGFGVAALVVCVSLLMAFTDKHMRFGKRTFNGLWGKLNDNLMSTLGMVLITFIIYELWTLVLAAVLTLCLGLAAPLMYVVVPIVWVAFHFVLTYLISFIYLWLPCMQITGFRTFEALRYGHILCEPIQGKLTVMQAVSLLFSEILIVLAIVYLPDAQIVSITVATLFYAILILQFCVRMQVVYFDREQIERADLKKYYE